MEEKKQDEKLNSVLSEAEEAENNVEAKLAMDEELPEAAAEAEAVLDAAEEEKPLDKNVKLMSPMRMVMRRFFRSKLSIAGIVMLAALFLFCWLGPVVYHKWGETETDRTGANDYGTPQIVYVKNDEGEVVGSFVQIIVTEKGINALGETFRRSPSRNGRAGHGYFRATDVRRQTFAYHQLSGGVFNFGARHYSRRTGGVLRRRGG